MINMPLITGAGPTGFRSRRLSSRLRESTLLGGAIIFLLTLIWAAVAVEITRLNRLVESESNRDVHNLAHAFVEEINSTVGTVDLSLLALRSHWVRNPGAFRDIAEQLQQSLQDKIIFQISVTDARGIMVFSSMDRDAKPLNLSDREHVRFHLDGRGDHLFISKPVLGRFSGQWSIQFTRSVYDVDGKFEGVIVASVSPAYFSRFHQQIDLGDKAAISLLLRDGTMLARSPQERENKILGTVFSQMPFAIEREKTFGLYRLESRVDGIDRFHAWRALPHYGLVVVVGKSAEEAYATSANRRWLYLGSGVGASLVLIALALAFHRSASQRCAATQALAEAETRWKLALEGAGEGVWDWDIDKGIAHLSERSQEILQIDSNVLACSAATLHTIVHPSDVATVARALRLSLTGRAPSLQVEHRVRSGAGTWRWVMSRGMLVTSPDSSRPVRMVGMIGDITDRKSREQQTAYLAQHDVLTGLPNRLLFNDRLRQALLLARRESSRLAVIYCDLDRFKPVNDHYGHDMGDKLLRMLATRLRGCLRQSDTIARVGGDEFAVLLPNLQSENDARVVATNLLRQLNTPFVIDNLTLEISGSFGIATYPTDGEDETTLLQSADRAMYRAKAEGRNQLQMHLVTGEEA